uniref:Sphingosine kinase 1 n=1 Tax=Bubo bubo TaxID=30461 RepID=A0A8C0END1_BUBBB
MALEDFQAVVQPMLAEADIATTVFVTERPHHAHEKVRDEDLSQWDTLVVMAGDGLLYEVRGTLPPRPFCSRETPSWVQAKLTLFIPHSNDHVAKKKLLTNCTFILCKGLHTQMDLVSLSTASGKRLFSFLGFGWGFISDVDIDSEKYRRLGNARFTLGTLQCLAKLRVYQGRLSYLPAVPDSAPQRCFGPSWGRFSASERAQGRGQKRDSRRGLLEPRGLVFCREQGPYGELAHPLSRAARGQLELCNRSQPGGSPGGGLLSLFGIKLQ